MTGQSNRGLAPSPPHPSGSSAPLGKASGRRVHPAVFYDRDALRFLGTWPRLQAGPAVYLIDRDWFNDLRAEARKRPRAASSDFAIAIEGRNVRRPATGLIGADYDAEMLDELTSRGKQLAIETEAEQWKKVEDLFARAKGSGEDATRKGRPELAQEFVAYFVLDVIDARLSMVEATGAVTRDFHATFPLGSIRGTYKKTLPPSMGGDNAKRVIGTIHTHYLFDPLVNVTSTATGTRTLGVQRIMRHGVSDVDVASAKVERVLVYAVDSKYLHRALPDGTKQDKLPRRGNILRAALKTFGGEP